MNENSLDEMLRLRKSMAEQRLAESKDASAASQAKKAMKTKGMFSKAGAAIGTVVGAYYGSPQEGAALGSMIGGQAGGAFADNKLKTVEAEKKYKEMGGENEDPISSLIGSLSKYGGSIGGEGGDVDLSSLKERL